MEEWVCVGLGGKEGKGLRLGCKMNTYMHTYIHTHTNIAKIKKNKFNLLWSRRLFVKIANKKQYFICNFNLVIISRLDSCSVTEDQASKFQLTVSSFSPGGFI